MKQSGLSKWLPLTGMNLLEDYFNPYRRGWNDTPRRDLSERYLKHNLKYRTEIRNNKEYNYMMDCTEKGNSGWILTSVHNLENEKEIK